jgi:hypothetical protein
LDDPGPDQPLRSGGFGDIEPANRITLAGPLSAEAVETKIEITPCNAGDGPSFEAHQDESGALRQPDPEPSQDGTPQQPGDDSGSGRRDPR